MECHVRFFEFKLLKSQQNKMTISGRGIRIVPIQVTLAALIAKTPITKKESYRRTCEI